MEKRTKQLVSLVDISECSKLAEAVEQALDLFRFDFKKEIREIAIKPSLCYYWKSSTGETTDHRVVEGLNTCMI